MSTPKRKTLSVSEFKTHALGIFDDIMKTGQSLVVTKFGKPLAKVIPFAGKGKNPVPGKLKGTVLHEGDIVSPLGAKLWKAAR